MYRNRFRIAESLRGNDADESTRSRALSFLRSPLSGTNKARKYLGGARGRIFPDAFPRYCSWRYRTITNDITNDPLVQPARPWFVSRNVISIWWKRGRMLSDILHLASTRCQSISRNVFRKIFTRLNQFNDINSGNMYISLA